MSLGIGMASPRQLLILTLALLAFKAIKADIQFVNHGYEEVVVAISPDVDETDAEGIIQGIKVRSALANN